MRPQRGASSRRGGHAPGALLVAALERSREDGPGRRDGRPQRPPVPSLGSFLRSRVVSVNGIVAALCLLLSLWIYLNPDRARAIWKRLQGQ